MSGVAGVRYKMKDRKTVEILFDMFGAYKMHSRPWAIAVNLVLFDQLMHLARKRDWGVRVANWPYNFVPDLMEKLHAAVPSLGHPPPPLPPTADSVATTSDATVFCDSTLSSASSAPPSPPSAPTSAPYTSMTVTSPRAPRQR